MKREIYFIFTMLLFISSCNNYNKLLKSTNYELKLEKANHYYEKKNYVRAQQLYEELIPIFKGSEKSEEIYYKYTWTHFYTGDYALAQFHFKNFVRQFPSSEKSEECFFMNGYCYYLNSPKYSLDQTATINAIKEMQSFIDAYPESKLVDSANTIINLLHYKLEKKEYEIIKQYRMLDDYKAVITAGINFEKDYPDSPYNEEIRFWIIEAYYLLGINSIPSKKKERLEKVGEYYLKFISLHPQSNFLKPAENYYIKSKQQLESL
ncbi:MAG: outer membrane protein assembly factor BamD [Bacteroidia bacterium]|nr:outer membrane protein assembly factor BamD [Bacteroidia bacterium]